MHMKTKRKLEWQSLFQTKKDLFKIKNIIKDKEGHYIVIKGSTQEDDITSVYAPNTGALQYIRQTLTGVRGEINSNTIIVGDFNTPTFTNGQIIKIENQ